MFVNQNMKTSPSLIGLEPAKPNHSLLEDCLVTTDRKKSSTHDQQPRKRMRGAGDPSEVTVKVVTANKRKRKTITNDQPPQKRLNLAGDPSEVTVTVVTANKRKRKTIINDQPPQKRLNLAGDQSEVTVKVVTANGRKRKAVANDQPPQKRLKDAGDQSEVTVTVVTAKTKKRVTTDVSHTSDVNKESGLNQTQPRDEELAAKQTTERRDKCDARPSYAAWISPLIDRENFLAKYMQLRKLGQGGFGSVYSGVRRTDNLPVAIKHIPKDLVQYQERVINNVVHNIPLEVLLMQAVAVENSEGKCAAVALLDWYNLEDEVLLVMERPAPCVDLYDYLRSPMKEDEAKVIMRQLVEATIHIQSRGVFHQDLKQENVLIETGSDIPRVRIIDFGGGCFDSQEPSLSFHGTSAYCPPEYFSEGTFWPCHATVWQLGALLHEMLKNRTFTTLKFVDSCSKPKNEVEKMKVTKCCKHLLKWCLAIDPRCRASLKEIQSHPWLK